MRVLLIICCAKPGHAHPVAKTSYVMGFAPWGWIIGSGLYLDDIDAIFWLHAEHLGLGIAAIVAVLLALSLLILATLTGPLGKLREVIGAVRDSGNSVIAPAFVRMMKLDHGRRV